LVANQYVIDPYQYKVDKGLSGCLIVFWIIWAPAALFVTMLAIVSRHPFFFVWLIFGWAGLFGIPYIFLTSKRKQIVQVTEESLILIGAKILPKSKKIIPRDQFRALTLELYDDESAYSLNFLYGGKIFPGRINFAYLIHPKDKAVVFYELRDFLIEHGLIFIAENKMEED
tara:strand:- start:279 stop:791 length:513 start_codon:yes stop_codon:yes gene_type:complete